MLLPTIPPPMPDWAQALGTFAAALLTGLAAWLVRGRKDARKPFNPAVNGNQARLLTRDEVHSVLQIVNVWADFSGRVKRAEEDMRTLKEADQDKGERLVRLEERQEETVRRMDSSEKRAEKDMDEIKHSLNRIEEKVDTLPRRAS